NVAGSAEVFGSESNSSAVLSQYPAMNGPTHRLEVPQRKANYAYLCATPLFNSNIAGEQVGREERRELRVGVQQPCHGLLAETKKGRVFIRLGRRHAQGLPGQAAFTEELISTEKRHDCFL